MAFVRLYVCDVLEEGPEVARLTDTHGVRLPRLTIGARPSARTPKQ